MKDIYVLLEGYTDDYDNQYFRYIGVFSTYEKALETARESDQHFDSYSKITVRNMISFIEQGMNLFTTWQIIKANIQ